jgi:hypothetical protein
LSTTAPQVSPGRTQAGRHPEGLVVVEDREHGRVPGHRVLEEVAVAIVYGVLLFVVLADT